MTLHTISITILVNFEGSTRYILAPKIIALYRTPVTENDHWHKYRGIFEFQARGARWDIVYKALAMINSSGNEVEPPTVKVQVDELFIGQGTADGWEGYDRLQSTLVKFVGVPTRMMLRL